MGLTTIDQSGGITIGFNKTCVQLYDELNREYNFKDTLAQLKRSIDLIAQKSDNESYKKKFNSILNNLNKLNLILEEFKTSQSSSAFINNKDCAKDFRSYIDNLLTNKRDFYADILKTSKRINYYIAYEYTSGFWGGLFKKKPVLKQLYKTVASGWGNFLENFGKSLIAVKNAVNDVKENKDIQFVLVNININQVSSPVDPLPVPSSPVDPLPVPSSPVVDQERLDPVDKPPVDPLPVPSSPVVDQERLDPVDKPPIDKLPVPSSPVVDQERLDPVDKPPIDKLPVDKVLIPSSADPPQDQSQAPPEIKPLKPNERIIDNVFPDLREIYIILETQVNELDGLDHSLYTDHINWYRKAIVYYNALIENYLVELLKIIPEEDDKKNMLNEDNVSELVIESITKDITVKNAPPNTIANLADIIKNSILNLIENIKEFLKLIKQSDHPSLPPYEVPKLPIPRYNSKIDYIPQISTPPKLGNVIKNLDISINEDKTKCKDDISININPFKSSQSLQHGGDNKDSKKENVNVKDNSKEAYRYNGKLYRVRYGPRGGKYIVVDKKKMRIQ